MHKHSEVCKIAVSFNNVAGCLKQHQAARRLHKLHCRQSEHLWMSCCAQDASWVPSRQSSQAKRRYSPCCVPVGTTPVLITTVPDLV